MADTSGILQGNFAGIPSLFTIPQVRAQITDLYRKQKLVELMKWFGVWEKTEDDKWYDVRTQAGFYSLDTTAATSVTGSGTATVTITGLVAGQSGKAIVGDTVELPAGTQARVQSVVNTAGLDTVVLKSFAAGNPNLTLVVGNVVRQISNAQEEGSEAPTSRVRGLDYIYNQLGIHRKSFTATDVQKMKTGKRIYVEVDGKETAYSVAMIMEYLQHRAEVASGLLLHQMSDPNFSNTSPTITGLNGRGVQTTRGLIPTINTYGSTVAAGVAGSPTLTDIENVITKIAQMDGPDHYAFIGSKQAITRMSSAFKALGSANTQPVRINLGANDTYVNFMVERITFGDVQFDLTSADAFDVPELFPVAGANYKSVWGIPMGNFPILSKSGTATSSAPYLGVRYGGIHEPGLGTEMEAEIRIGALAPTYNEGTNIDQTTWCSAVGLSTPKPEAFIKLTGILP